MDSANEATEQLNRAERFLTEIQDNPGFFLDNFSQFHKFANNICLFKVKDDPEAAMNIKQAETMLGTLRWGAIKQLFSQSLSYEDQFKELLALLNNHAEFRTVANMCNKIFLAVTTLVHSFFLHIHS